MTFRARAASALPRLLGLTLLSMPLLAGASGCALFRLAGASVGNERPVEEKSQQYRVADLSQKNTEWIKLESGISDSTRTDISDVAFQSRQDASIISLNSACRKGTEDETEDLQKLSSHLFLGLTDITLQEQRRRVIQGEDALETTVQGNLSGSGSSSSASSSSGSSEEMKLRSVVIKRGACVYDLLYMARPKHFPNNEQDFAHFVDSLRFK